MIDPWIRVKQDLYSRLFVDGIDETMRRALIGLADSKWRFAIIGGFVREVHLLGIDAKPRDLDIVVDGPDLPELSDWLSANGLETSTNSYGGIKARTSKLTLDIWPIEMTWAIKSEYVPSGISNLPRCTFLNLDSIVAEYTRGDFVIHESGYLDGVRRRILEINQQHTPSRVYAIMKSFVLAARYDFALSLPLLHFIRDSYATLGPILETAILEEHGKHSRHPFLDMCSLKAWLRLVRIASSNECDSLRLPLPRPRGIAAEDASLRQLRHERELVRRNHHLWFPAE